ncbi:MAG: hypothetical protein KC416_06240 [Myxococcales bacterium]|nr:hypothetical protein [Myxococcales bacterium]
MTHLTRHLLQRGFVALGLLGVLAGIGGLALAQETTQETINGFTVKIQAIEAADKDKITTQELGFAKAWLGEAQAQLTQEKEEELANTVKRIHVSIALMEAKLQKADEEKKAAAAAETAKKIGQAVNAMRKEIEGLKKEIDDLSKKVEK